jgi:hypothetical protein
MRGSGGTMSEADYRRAAEIIQNYRGVTIWPSREERDAFWKMIMRRVFTR